MIEKPQDATRSNVQAVTMKRFDEVVMPRIAASFRAHTRFRIDRYWRYRNQSL